MPWETDFDRMSTDLSSSQRRDDGGLKVYNIIIISAAHLPPYYQVTSSSPAGPRETSASSHRATYATVYNTVDVQPEMTQHRDDSAFIQIYMGVHGGRRVERVWHLKNKKYVRDENNKYMQL